MLELKREISGEFEFIKAHCPDRTLHQVAKFLETLALEYALSELAPDVLMAACFWQTPFFNAPGIPGFLKDSGVYHFFHVGDAERYYDASLSASWGETHTVHVFSGRDYSFYVLRDIMGCLMGLNAALEATRRDIGDSMALSGHKESR